MKLKPMLLLLLLCSGKVSAQEPQQLFYRDLGFSGFTDLGRSPVSNNSGGGFYSFYLSIMSYTYRLRYDIWQDTSERLRSVSVNLPASVGLSFVFYQPDKSPAGGNITLPFFINYNRGLLAKKVEPGQKDEFGLTLGVGFAMHYVPMVYFSTSAVDPPRMYAMPMMNVGARFMIWTKPHEVNLQVGWLPSQPYNGVPDAVRPFAVKVTFFTFLNYEYDPKAKERNRPGAE